MRFLQEKYSRRYFVFLIGFSAALLFTVLFLTWLHGRECQKLLFEREQTMVSSLIGQGMSSPQIAEALKNSVSSEEGSAFLHRIGHAESASFHLFPSIRQSVFSFSKTAVFILGFFAVVLIGISVRFLMTLEKQYQAAADIIRQFADGNFADHLPQNEDGTLFQLFASVEEMASALQAQNENEKRAKEFLKNTISDISHQLKTPLAALNMYVEILSEEPDHIETVQKFSEKSMRSLERINSLIQSLLKMARLDAGSIVFRRQKQSVSELVASAMENLTARAELEEKQIIVRGDSKETLFCDFQWTGEAIGNLIKNALEHTSCKGTIFIEWKRSPGMFRLSVSDDGCGIAQEDIHHIFKRFYTKKGADARQGAGLGLPLAKAVIEGQNGILSVNSTLGEGTVFTVSFLTDS